MSASFGREKAVVHTERRAVGTTIGLIALGAMVAPFIVDSVGRGIGHAKKAFRQD